MSLDKLKRDISIKLDEYINNKFFNIFTRHHHNNRAISTKDYVNKAGNIATVKWIIANEKCLFETGLPLSKYKNYDYNQSNYSKQLKNKNVESSTYYKKIVLCEELIKYYQESVIRTSFTLQEDYNNKPAFFGEAQDVTERKGIDDSFILGNDIVLEPSTYYIYLIYCNRYLSDDPEIRIVKMFAEGTPRHHSTLAHHGKFDADYYQRLGIKKDVKVLMGGEIATGENSFEIKVTNKSGHFRPTNSAFENYKQLIRDTLGDNYLIEFINVGRD